MQVIHKVKLEAARVREQTIPLPINARILDIQCQLGDVCLWYAFNPAEVHLRRMQFTTIGTGREYPETVGDYIGTVQDNGYVWHIFVRPV